MLRLLPMNTASNDRESVNTRISQRTTRSNVMGVNISVSLTGLKSELKHGPSGALIYTVPPIDNGGDGSLFSPTDLLAASLASCAITTMALISKKENLEFLGATAQVEKEMSPPPRRVASLALKIVMPKETKIEIRARLEEIAKGCPVARSLSADVSVPVTFEYL
jgi:putative redox protein